MFRCKGVILLILLGNILCQEQCRFHPGHGTVDQLFSFQGSDKVLLLITLDICFGHLDKGQARADNCLVVSWICNTKC